MFRTPFSCGYYQYIENIHLARTKIILNCLFLLEAHGLELYYRPFLVRYLLRHVSSLIASQLYLLIGRIIAKKILRASS